MKCLRMSIKILGRFGIQPNWNVMWTELVFKPVWNLKPVWLHFTSHVNVLLVIAKLNWRKDFILRGFVCDTIRPSKELLLQSSQMKHTNKFWKLFKIKNEEHMWIYFKLCPNCWVWTGKRLLVSYWKDKHFWIQDRVCYALCCSILLTNSIWTYTITTLE